MPETSKGAVRAAIVNVALVLTLGTRTRPFVLTAVTVHAKLWPGVRAWAVVSVYEAPTNLGIVKTWPVVLSVILRV